MYDTFATKKGKSPVSPFTSNPAPLPFDPAEVDTTSSPEACLALLTLARDTDASRSSPCGYPPGFDSHTLPALAARAHELSRTKSSALRRLLDNLASPRPRVLAQAVRRAVKGLGTRDTDLVTALCCAPAEDVLAAKEAYPEVCDGRGLVADVEGDTSGDYEDLLVRLVTAGRPEAPKTVAEVDAAAAESDAAALRSAGEGRLGTDEAAIADIVANRSVAHMKAVAERYSPGDPAGLYNAIVDEISGDFGRALAALAAPWCHVARAVHSAVDGAGTDDKRLAEALVLPRKDVLAEARRVYPFMYRGHTMEKDLESDESGSMRTAVLLAIAATPADAVAFRVRLATKGLGTDSDAVVAALTAPRVTKRDAAAADAAYTRAFGGGDGDGARSGGLRACLASEESGGLKKFLVALATPRAELVAREIRRCIDGLGTDDTALAECMASVPGALMAEVRSSYAACGWGSLVDDIESDTSFNQENALVALANGSKRADAPGGPDAVPEARAREIAADVHAAGEARLGTDDGRLVSILTTASSAELRAAAGAYEAEFGTGFLAALESETSGGFEKVLVALADPLRATAYRVRRAVKGLGTDDDALVMLLASRDREQVRDLAKRYGELFAGEGRSMVKDIQEDTSGRFQTALLAWIRG